MMRKNRNIIVSLLLFVGLALSGIAVQRPQETRKKAAEPSVEASSGDGNVLISYKITRPLDDRVAIVDLYADTNGPKKIGYFNIKFNYYQYFNFEVVKNEENDCKLNSMLIEDKGGGISEGSFSGNCQSKSGKLYLGRMIVTGNLNDAKWYQIYYMFNKEIGSVFGDGDYKMKWASGYVGTTYYYDYLSLPLNTVTDRLIQMSYKISRSGKGSDKKYFVDIYADTNSKDIVFDSIMGHVNFSKSLDLVEQSDTEFSRAALINYKNSYDIYQDTFLSNFIARGNVNEHTVYPSGKILIASFVFTTNSPDATHILIFNDDIYCISSYIKDGYGVGYSINKIQWVSGYSNIIDLDKREPGKCGDCKKVGDYDCNGTVDGLDYSWWKQEFVDKLSHDGKWEAIPDCSGEVTTEGYSVWRYNYLE